MCHQNKPHKVLSVEDGQVNRVSCLACEHEHVLNSAVTDDSQSPEETEEIKPKTAAKPKAPTKPKTATDKKAPAAKTKPTKTQEAKPVKSSEAKAAKTQEPDPSKSQETNTVKSQESKPPKESKEAKEAKETKDAKETKEAKEAKEAKKAADEELDLNKERWLELKTRLGNTKPVDYYLEGDFTIDQVLNHAKFGLGFVTKVFLPNKIEVQFEEGLKTMVMHVNQEK
jgi:type IV secretory pathway VirB10-like protein